MNHYPLILLHGWGFSSQLWQPLIKTLHTQGFNSVYPIDLPGFGSAFHEPCGSLEQVLDSIVEQLPEKSVLCGWSLGGMLAIQIAARYPGKIAAVITVGSNLHFTNHNDWPGMPAADYEQFCQRFSIQPQKTWQRFLALQTRGDTNAAKSESVLELLADYSAIEPTTAEKMLGLLGKIDNRHAFTTLAIPGLHVLAENDAITPVAIAPLFENINTNQQIKILSGSSHAIPVSRTAQLADLITDFLLKKKQVDKESSEPEYIVEKSRIADSFSRAASSYDNAAQLQRNIGSALLSALPDNMAGTVIDIGCGTGFISRELLKKYGRDTNVIALDFSSGMLQSIMKNQTDIVCVRADMEQMPFATRTADWLISNLALQWANAPLQCFQQWRHILKPDGELFFATFLPGTLRELEQSWREVDDAIHVNRFIDHGILLDALHAAEFLHVESVTATHTVYYPEVSALARELKAIGAHNMNKGQATGMTGKQRWKKMQATYELLRSERGLPATYEVLYVSAR
ncbi:MAG TPA: malonyl-ACP O-methyltransferase BioC [Pseudomonadales bacterium]|nr:malonyl-ACP O-methyltransferase BioC [Pseudomonadales bacterium]